MTVNEVSKNIDLPVLDLSSGLYIATIKTDKDALVNKRFIKK